MRAAGRGRDAGRCPPPGRAAGAVNRPAAYAAALEAEHQSQHAGQGRVSEVHNYATHSLARAEQLCLRASAQHPPLVQDGGGAHHQRRPAVVPHRSRCCRALALPACEVGWRCALQAHAGGVHPGVALVTLQPEACTDGCQGRHALRCWHRTLDQRVTREAATSPATRAGMMHTAGTGFFFA